MYMLEKLITNLKKSLPEPLRKKLGVAEEEEVSEEQEEEETSEAESSENEAPSADEDKKKKQISMIIRVVVILVIGYMALDEFVLKQNSSEPSVEELLNQAPKRKRPKKVPAVAENQAPTTNEAPPQEATVPAEGSTNATAEAPIENINVLDKTAESGSTTTDSSSLDIPTSNDVVVDSKPVDTSVDQKIDQMVENVNQNESSSSSSSSSMSSGSGSGMEEVQIPSMGQSSSKDNSMASKIVEDVVETAPPAYDQIGRGLVYNCKDKYWACVDKPAYVICNKNMKWNKSKGSSAECVVQAIYNSDDDCAKVQKYNVSTNQATGFCQ